MSISKVILIFFIFYILIMSRKYGYKKSGRYKSKKYNSNKYKKYNSYKPKQKKTSYVY